MQGSTFYFRRQFPDPEGHHHLRQPEGDSPLGGGHLHREADTIPGGVPHPDFENRLPLMTKRYKIGGYSSDNDSFCITTVFFGTIITE